MNNLIVGQDILIQSINLPIGSIYRERGTDIYEGIIISSYHPDRVICSIPQGLCVGVVKYTPKGSMYVRSTHTLPVAYNYLWPSAYGCEDNIFTTTAIGTSTLIAYGIKTQEECSSIIDEHTYANSRATGDLVA